MAQELENKKSLPANVDDRQFVYVRYEGEDEEELGFYMLGVKRQTKEEVSGVVHG